MKKESNPKKESSPSKHAGRTSLYSADLIAQTGTNMKNGNGATVSEFLVALNQSDSDISGSSIQALKDFVIADENTKSAIAEAILARFRQMPTSNWNALIAAHLWRRKLFQMSNTPVSLDNVEQFLSDRLVGLDYKTQTGILRACVQIEKPSVALKQAMDRFLSTKPVGRPLLSAVLFLLRNNMEAEISEAFKDGKYAQRVHTGLLRVKKEIDRAFEVDAIAAEDDRFYLTAMSKLTIFLNQALGAEGEIFKTPPLPSDGSSFHCSKCGRVIKVASFKTDARMSVKCSSCGSRMHGPPDTE